MFRSWPLPPPLPPKHVLVGRRWKGYGSVTRDKELWLYLPGAHCGGEETEELRKGSSWSELWPYPPNPVPVGWRRKAFWRVMDWITWAFALSLRNTCWSAGDERVTGACSNGLSRCCIRCTSSTCFWSSTCCPWPSWPALTSASAAGCGRFVTNGPPSERNSEWLLAMV